MMMSLNATESPLQQQLTYIELFHQNGDQHTLAMWLIMGEKCAPHRLAFCSMPFWLPLQKLHKSCNVLLALDSMFLAMFQLNSLITLLIAVFGINFVPNSTCFYFQAVPIFSVLMSFCLMFQIGLERLANVVLPICMNNGSKKFHALFLCVSVASNLLLIWLCFSAYHDINTMAMCTSSDISGKGLFYTISFNRSVIMHFLMVIIYIAIVLVLKFKNENQNFSKSIFRSLRFLVFLESIGWIPSIYLGQFLKFAQYSPITTTYISAGFATISSCITASANGPTLYYFSHLYRKEINAFLESIGIKKSIGTQHQQHTNAIQLNVVTRYNNWTHH